MSSTDAVEQGGRGLDREHGGLGIGLTVVKAHDSVEAMDTLATWWPEIVILDIGLPGLDGYALAERIRAARGAGHPRSWSR